MVKIKIEFDKSLNEHFGMLNDLLMEAIWEHVLPKLRSFGLVRKYTYEDNKKLVITLYNIK